MPNGQTFTDYFDIEPEISGGMPTDIANGSDMDSAPVGLNCADIMAQYCLFAQTALRIAVIGLCLTLRVLLSL